MINVPKIMSVLEVVLAQHPNLFALNRADAIYLPVNKVLLSINNNLNTRKLVDRLFVWRSF